MNGAMPFALLAILLALLASTMSTTSNSGGTYKFEPPTWQACADCPKQPCELISKSKTENSTTESYRCGP